VRGIAQRVAAEKNGSSLDQRIIVELPVSELIAGTGVRGALASKFAAIRRGGSGQVGAGGLSGAGGEANTGGQAGLGGEAGVPLLAYAGVRAVRA
jgi:hypothetical protein